MTGTTSVLHGDLHVAYIQSLSSVSRALSPFETHAFQLSLASRSLARR